MTTPVAESQPVRPRQGRRGPQGRPGPPGPSGGSQRSGGAQRVGQGVRQAAGRKSTPTSYQGAILAEFVAAVILVAATPFAKKDQPGISPYVATDVMQLVAITVVYLVLALLSGVNRGAARFSAWFGLLLLLGIGLGEAARLAKLLDVFGLQAKADAQPQGGQ